MTYEIRENRQYNSHEVYFDAIPPFEVRDALKGLKMKWNRKKSLLVRVCQRVRVDRSHSGTR